MTKEDADETRVYDHSALLKQREEKQKKQDLLKKNNMRKASEYFIDALYYYERFKSEACWMTASIVNIELKKIKSRTAKQLALKENIRISNRNRLD